MKKVKLLALALAVCALCGALLTGCGDDDTPATGSEQSTTSSDKITINLNDYVIVTGEGYDGCSTVLCGMDYARLFQDYADRIDLKENENGYYVELLDEDGKVESTYKLGHNTEENNLETWFLWNLDIRPVLKVASEPDGEALMANKSNGDQMDVVWQVEDTTPVRVIGQILNANIVYSDFTDTVEGLIPLKDVDPFAYIDFTMGGDHGEIWVVNDATIYIEISDTETKKARVNVEVPENNNALRNGDTLHVSLPDKYDAAFVAQNYGMRFTRTEADIEIHGQNGNPDYVPGDPAVVKLNDYLMIGEIGDYEANGGLEIGIDYEKLIRHYSAYLSENVAKEDLLGYYRAKDAARKIFGSYPPVEISSSNYTLVEDQSYFGGNLSNGDVVELTWKPNPKNIEMLQKVLNVELVYEDFSHTMSTLKSTGESDSFED